MGILSNPITDILGKIIDKVVPDPQARAELQLELAKLADAEAARASNERIAQAEVNKAEASSSSIFVAGWRPAAGWACVISLIYVMVAAPLFHLGVPEDMSFVRDVLLGMLGINVTARSIEKVKGVAENTLNPSDTSVKKPILKRLGKALWPF